MRRGEKCDIDTSRRVGRSQSWAICFPSRSGSRFKKRKFLIVLCRESLFVCNLHVSSLIPTESSRVTRVVGPLILNKVLLVLWSGRVGPERQTEDKVCRRNYSVVLLLEQSERVESLQAIGRFSSSPKPKTLVNSPEEAEGKKRLFSRRRLCKQGREMMQCVYCIPREHPVR